MEGRTAVSEACRVVIALTFVLCMICLTVSTEEAHGLRRISAIYGFGSIYSSTSFLQHGSGPYELVIHLQ